MLSQWIDRLWELNPQLFREAKGRLIQRNITIATISSLLGQGLVYLLFRSFLPPLSLEKVVSSFPYSYPENKYCLGASPETDIYTICIPDALGNVPINWQLWWLDLFMAISLISIIVLVVVGVYLLIADLSKEEQRGTLGFIRLSPQSASSILIGKILGVPILLYWFVGLAIPLHFSAALQAGIPVSLLLAFYGVLGISYSFFYSASLLLALVSKGLRGFQAWLGSGAVLLFMTILSQFFADGYRFMSYGSTPFGWLLLLYPGSVLPYLVEATGLDYSNFLGVEELANISWFGQSLWLNAVGGILFIVANFALLNHWIWAGLKRRFHNNSTGVWSKSQSYWLSGSLTLVVLGFVSQVNQRDSNVEAVLMANFGLLLGFELLLMLVLIAALSPHRQTLQDWARYRHQEKGYARSLIKDLIWGEKSPAVIAIALNLIITSAIILPFVFLAPLESYRFVVLGGMLIQATSVMLYAIVAQLCLFSKSPKRVVLAAGSVASLILILPFFLFVVFFEGDSAVMIFSPIPLLGIEAASSNLILLSLLGQWSGLILFGRQLQLQLQKAGESSSKQLMTRGKALSS